MSTIVKRLISAAHVAIFTYGFLLQRNDSELSNINAIGFSIYCSRGAALCLAFDMAIIMLLVCRKLLSYIARIVFAFNIGHGTISEGSNSSLTYYHRFLAYHILVFLTIHLLGHCVNFYRLEQLGRGSAMSYHFGTWAGVTGYWMLLLLGIMFITAHQKIRKRNYEVFWYTHHLALLVMAFYTFHGYGCFVKTNDGECRGYNSWKYIVLASIIYVIERLLRTFESFQPIVLSSAIAHPGGAIELNFKQPSLHYRPGQHVYLNIPRLSKFEWHPFTITSSPFEQYISLDIRQDGDWTRNLARLLGYGPETPRIEQIQVVRDRSLLPLIKVDGPYGGPKDDVLDFDHAVLIGTGNGITTFSGILRHIWFRHQETQSSRLETLDLYWVSRDANKLEWFQSLFSMEKTMELFRTGLIRIHIYFTSETAYSSSSSSPSPSALCNNLSPRRSSSIGIKRSQQNDEAIRRENKRTQNPLPPAIETTTTTESIGLASGSGRRRYSEDDDEHEEHEELLSPLDRYGGGDSALESGLLISLQSISSPSINPQPTSHSSTATAAAAAVARAAENIEQGDDAIIGPNNIHFGRPDFATLFEDMKSRLLFQEEESNGEGNDSENDGDGNQDIGQQQQRQQRQQGRRRQRQQSSSAGKIIRVGVFYCGSPGLGRTLAHECSRSSDSRIKFVFSGQ